MNNCCYLIVIILIFLIYKRREEFTGKIYAKDKFRGKSMLLEKSKDYILYEPTKGFVIYSVEAPSKKVFKVFSPGFEMDSLYIQNLKRIDNLPAAIGALPVAESYFRLFDQKKKVFIKAMDAEEAKNEIEVLRKQCISTKSETKCNNQFIEII